MDRRTCLAQLEHAHVPFSVLAPAAAPSVAQPIRLTGPLAGVTFDLVWSPSPKTDRHAIWDCRLAVAMLPVATWLAARGVDRATYFSVLRGHASSQRRRGRHSVGLAIDLAAVHRANTRISVRETFPKNRLRTCSDVRVSDPSAALWIDLVCLLVERQGVHTLLTPDHDQAHHNHLHLDLKSVTQGRDGMYVSFAGGRR